MDTYSYEFITHDRDDALTKVALMLRARAL